jgi:hypothetical protein
MDEVVVKKRGRPRKVVVKLVEYKNVTENEKMWFEIYGEEDERRIISIEPGATEFFCDKDLRKYNNDKRFLEGRIVPVGSEEDKKSTREASDIMTDDQIKYFIKNTDDAKEIAKKIRVLKSVNTVKRMLHQAKDQDKPYSIVKVFEDKLEEIINVKEEKERKDNE